MHKQVTVKIRSLESLAWTVTHSVIRVRASDSVSLTFLNQALNKLLSADLPLLLLLAVTVVVLVAGVEVAVLLVAGVVVTVKESRLTVVD